MIIELIRGSATLLALCLVETFVQRYWRHNIPAKLVFSGLLFGLICIVGMVAPIHFSPGVIFDARSVVLSMAGLFGGPVVGAIAGVIAGGYRLWLGGAGAIVGLEVVIGCVLAGLLYRHFHHRGWVKINFLNLMVFGFLVHVFCLALFIQLPTEVVKRLFDNLLIPYLTAFTIATPFLGLILKDVQDRLAVENTLKKISIALRESDSRFRAVFNQSPNGITLKDRHGCYLLVNQTYAQWHNMTPDQIIGLSADDLFPDRERQRARKLEHDLLISGEPCTLESDVPFLDGETRFLSIFKSPLIISPNEPPLILTVLANITDRRRAEISMESALNSAEEANRAKTELLATMSHELRTPLNAILGFSDMIRSQYYGPLGSDTYVEYANDIYKSGDHLLSLINDILDISAIEAGKRVFQKEPVNIDEIIAECLKTLQGKIKERDISISVRIPDEARTFNADKRSVFQILLNLLSNAVKFTGLKSSVTVDSRLSGNNIEIIVTDSGDGIAPDKLAKITEPFVQAETNPHWAQEGTGLGLTVVKSLVDAHSGQLHFESEPGQGLTVTVSLPMNSD